MGGEKKIKNQIKIAVMGWCGRNLSDILERTVIVTVPSMIR